MWNHLPSSRPVTLWSGFSPRLSHVPASCPPPGPDFHEMPQFGCGDFQGLKPIPNLTLLHPVQILRRWPQDMTCRPLTFGCKSATCTHMKTSGVTTTMRGSLARIALHILFPWCKQEKDLRFIWVQVIFVFLGGGFLETDPHTRFHPSGTFSNIHDIKR